jgi:peptidoglycan/xylan/chitin deacetylase (PgdA/CDA1 family)
MKRPVLSFPAAVAIAAALLWISGCDQPRTGTQAPRVGSTQAAITGAEIKQIDFSFTPTYHSNKWLALTFDDGPDWGGNTESVLNTLAAKGVKATFFINANNWSNLNVDEPMRQLVRRMVNEGHELASHTNAHAHLGQLTSTQIEAEIVAVENVVNSIFGASAPKLTLLRAPFGEPYQGANLASISAELNKVATVVNNHAVHIGWAIDPHDYNCAAGNATCVFNNFKAELDAGHYGQVLLHSVQSQTALALGQIIDHARSRGYEFRSTEDMVQARYGKKSCELIYGAAACGVVVTPPPPDAGTPDAGTPDAGTPPAGVPEIDFAIQPSYLPNTNLVLTFDDGPDWGDTAAGSNTVLVLDALARKGVKATFFINSNNWSSLADVQMQNIVKRIVQDGHELGSHTATHQDLATLTTAQISTEISAVQTSVNGIFGATAPKLTLLRAPYGSPYQYAVPSSAEYLKVTPIVKQSAVHVGWAIDTEDWNCTTATCVVNNFKAAIDAGHYGVVIMHSPYNHTALAVEQIIDYAISKGKVFKKTEDVVKAKYAGKSSYEIIYGGTPPAPPPPVASLTPIAGGHYGLKSQLSAKVAQRNGTTSGSTVVQQPDAAALTQRWTFTALATGVWQLKNRSTSFCLDVNGSTATAVTQRTCSTTNNFRWTFTRQADGTDLVRNTVTNKCLSVANTTSGTALTVATCSTTSTNQKWKLFQP